MPFRDRIKVASAGAQVARNENERTVPRGVLRRGPYPLLDRHHRILSSSAVAAPTATAGKFHATPITSDLPNDPVTQQIPQLRAWQNSTRGRGAARNSSTAPGAVTSPRAPIAT